MYLPSSKSIRARVSSFSLLKKTNLNQMTIKTCNNNENKNNLFKRKQRHLFPFYSPLFCKQCFLFN